MICFDLELDNSVIQCSTSRPYIFIRPWFKGRIWASHNIQFLWERLPSLYNTALTSRAASKREWLDSIYFLLCSSQCVLCIAFFQVYNNLWDYYMLIIDSLVAKENKNMQEPENIFYYCRYIRFVTLHYVWIAHTRCGWFFFQTCFNIG